MTEKELEILFQKKFKERAVEFNPEAWKGAEKLIIEGERRRRTRKIVAWTSVAAIVLMGGAMSWNMTQIPNESVPAIVSWPNSTPKVESISNQEPVSELPTAPLEVDLKAEVSIPTLTSSDASVESSDLSTASVTTLPIEAGLLEDASEATFREDLLTVASRSFQEIEEYSVEDLPSLQRPLLLNLFVVADPENAIFVEVPKPEDIAAPVIFAPKHIVEPLSVSLLGGLNFTQLLNSQSGMKSSFFGGLEAEYTLSSNSFVELQLIYARRASFGTSENQSTVLYGFGSTTIQKSSTSLWVDYIELPFSYGYSIGDHSLRAGMYGAYKAYSLSKVVQANRASNESSTVDSYWAKSSMDHNSNWDFGIQLGYKYHWNSRWSLIMSGSYGLMDGFTLADSGMNQHLQCRAGLTYRIW